MIILFDIIIIYLLNLLLAWSFATTCRLNKPIWFYICFSTIGTLATIAPMLFDMSNNFLILSLLVYVLLVIGFSQKLSLSQTLLKITIILTAAFLCSMLIFLSMTAIKASLLFPFMYLGDWDHVILRLLLLLFMATIIPLVTALCSFLIEKQAPSKLHMIVVIPISQLFAIVTISFIFSSNDKSITGYLLAGVTLLLFLLADIGLLYAFRNIRRNEELRHLNTHMQDQLQLQFEHYKKLAASTERMQKLRHDMINHLETMRLLVADQPQGKADQLLSSYSAKLAQTKLFHYCHNKIVEAVLINKQELAKKHGVSLTVNVAWPYNAEFGELDLCSLFTNLLDNAISAAASSTLNDAERLVKLDCYSHDAYLIIRCWNTKAHAIKRNSMGRILSTKQDQTLQHGIGLQILSDIASKYSGELRTEYGENYFKTTIYLLEETA